MNEYADIDAALPEREARVLRQYEDIAAASERMLEAARAADWDALSDARDDCVFLIEALRALGGAAELSAASRRLRLRSLGRVLAHDAEIRRLADPGVLRLEHLLAGRLRVVDGGRA